MFKYKRPSPLGAISNPSEVGKKPQCFPHCGAPPKPTAPPLPPAQVDGVQGLTEMTPERRKAIRQLRVIADDIERGFDGFNYLVGYDFVNLSFDIAAGEAKRKKASC